MTPKIDEKKSNEKFQSALNEAVSEAVGKRVEKKPRVTVSDTSNVQADEDGKKYMYIYRAKTNTTFGVNFYAQGDILKRTVEELPHGNFEYVGKEEIVEQEEEYDPLYEAIKKSRNL